MRLGRALQAMHMSSLPRYSLVPGPTRIAPSTLSIYGSEGFDASPDLEEGFFRDYAACQKLLRAALGCRAHDVVALMSGEAMVALWGAVKSVLLPGDAVLCISNGIFGDGFADMAKAVGAEPTLLSFGYDAPIDVARVRQELQAVRPRLVTAVHCDTPSGTMNRNLEEIGRACREVGALFLVDFVASAFAAPVEVDKWNIDLGLLGSQKVLSLPPDLGVLTISSRAWEAAERVKYRGYDAILPFRTAVERRHMPYSHNWRAVSAMRHVLESINVEESYARHEAVARMTRERITKMGLDLFTPESLAAPTVTAVKVPGTWTWPELDSALRKKQVVFGGSYGSLKNVVFRIGHMGSQANVEMVSGALDCLESVLKEHKEQ